MIVSMASHQTFLPPRQESKFNLQRASIRRDDRTTDRKKEGLIALPPVQGKAVFYVFVFIFTLTEPT